MRVVFLNPTPELGGAERSLLDLLASLRQARPQLEAHLIVGGPGPLGDRAEELGAVVHRIAMPSALLGLGDSELASRSGLGRAGVGARLARLAPKAAWATQSYVRSLRRRLAALAPDVIHSNALKTHALTPLLGAAPVVWHLRDYVGARPLIAPLLRAASRRAACGVCISRSLERDARAALGSRLPLEVIYNGVDLEAFRPHTDERDPAWLDAAAGREPAPAGTVRVGLIATYGRWKGHDVFLRAAAYLGESKGPVRYYVIGGPLYQTAGSQFERAELEGVARALGIDDRVAFVPFQLEPAPVYRALDVVVHASTRPEPFGRTIAEGMACGRAVVVAEAGGAAELFSPERDALGVPPNQPQALARALGRLVAQPELRAKLGAAARVTAEARFGRARLGEQVGALYDRVRR